MFSQRLLISGLAFAALVAPAFATTTMYCDSACGINTSSAFNNATVGLYFSNINFLTTTYNPSFGYTDTGTGTLFGDANSNPANLAVSSTCSNSPCPGGQVTDNGFGFTVQLPSTAYAFRLYIPSTSSGASVSVSFNAESTHFNTSMSTVQGALFFGAVTNAPITGLSVTGYHLNMDNFDVFTPAPAPEVATMVLIGTGLICLRLFRPRKDPRNS